MSAADDKLVKLPVLPEEVRVKVPMRQPARCGVASPQGPVCTTPAWRAILAPHPCALLWPQLEFFAEEEHVTVIPNFEHEEDGGYIACIGVSLVPRPCPGQASHAGRGRGRPRLACTRPKQAHSRTCPLPLPSSLPSSTWTSTPGAGPVRALQPQPARGGAAVDGGAHGAPGPRPHHAAPVAAHLGAQRLAPRHT